MEREAITARIPAQDAKRPSLHHAIEITDFMLPVELSCGRSEHLRLLGHDEILRTLAPASQRERAEPDRWKVIVSWRGERRVLHPKPDKLFGVQNANRPEGGNRRFFMLEVDRGTMPVVRPTLEQTSIVRKYLAYSETYRSKLHERHFGLPGFRVLFVTKAPEWVETMLAAYQENRADLAAPGVFLFADWRTIRTAGDALAASWRNGAGNAVQLLG